MIDRTHPAFARRIRLSTGAIVVAVILTGIAMLAIAAAVRPDYNTDSAAVVIEGPVSAILSQPRQVSAKDAEAKIIPVADTVAPLR